MKLVRPPDDPTVPHRLRRASILLGFAMGGFFDGILLHQILQWHHLLSNVQAGPLGSLSAQVAADGVFHAIMYIVAVAGLIELYRARSAATTSPAIRPRWGHFWIGFGVWHIIDALLSHWITGIHRIKMDADNPLVWDLAWFVVFGLVPLLYGWRTRNHRRPPPTGRAGKTFATLLVAGVLAGGDVKSLSLARGRRHHRHRAAARRVARGDVPGAGGYRCAGRLGGFAGISVGDDRDPDGEEVALIRLGRDVRQRVGGTGRVFGVVEGGHGQLRCVFLMAGVRHPA